MFRNYFKIAWRSLVKNKSYSFINISGLAVGIAAALLISVVVSYELNYDTFQKNYNNIYRIVTNTKHVDGSESYNPGIQLPAIDALRASFPQFEKMAPVSVAYGVQFTILGGDANHNVADSKKFLEDNVIAFTQPSYFEIFNATWLTGNKEVLNNPGSIVLTKTLASKYFGDWKNAEGKFVKLDNNILLKITGVVDDAPENSDFPIGAFLSYEKFKQTGDTYGYTTEWGNLGSNNQLYVLLHANANTASVNKSLSTFVQIKSGSHSKNKRIEQLQPLKEMHFDHRYGTLGDHTSSKSILFTLALIGVLIIIMASINYINLSTAQAINRSKEVGIRKVLGSTRSQLISQVMGETFIIVFISALIALLIAKLSLPYLSHVAAVPADIALLNFKTLIVLASVIIVVTILSGVYPAMILSGYKPVLALKSKITAANVGGISLRRILVVTQFAISQILIIGTIVAVSQMNFVRNADLGFNKEAVLMIPTFGDSNNLSRMKPLKQQLLQNPDVLSVSFASDEASSDNNSASNFAFDHKDDEDFALFIKNGDEDYIKTFGLHLIAGKDYAAGDTLKEMVVNETLLRKLHITNPQQAVGKQIRIGGGNWATITGVVKDFKTNSLRDEVPQLAIFPAQTNYSTVAVKLNTANMAGTVAQIQKIWEKTYPEYAFTSHFSDETIESFYKQETQLALLYKIFAGIAIFISCLGLYGLVSFMAAQKTKEVGIRKVLGATVTHIVYLFSKEFILLIIIAFVIAIPVSWYFMNNWLQTFTYRINVGISVFALAIIASLVIGLFTISYRAIKAAISSPVKSLRTE